MSLQIGILKISSSNGKLALRLAVGFGIVLLLMATMVGVGFTQFTNVSETNRQLIEKDWVNADAINAITATAGANAHETMSLLLVEEAAHFAEISDRINSNRKKVDAALATLNKTVHTAQSKTLLSRIEEERAQYIDSVGTVIRLVADGRRDEASRSMLGTVLPALNKLQMSMKSMSELQKNIAEATALDVKREINAARMQMLMLCVAAILMGIGFAYWIHRSLACPFTCCERH